MSKIERGLCKYNYDQAETVVSFFGAYMTREIIDKKIFGKLQYYTFEDTKLLGAEHYDEFLSHYYGEWKLPPSDANKDKHSIRKIVYKN